MLAFEVVERRFQDMVCRLEDATFETECNCLRRNMECGPDCGCAGSGLCVNRAVQERRPLQLGRDIQEVNAWGIDCYTRRNIRDGRNIVPSAHL